MRNRKLKYGIIFFVVLIAVVVLSSFLYKYEFERQAQEFEVYKFNEIEYSAEELELFCDIAFKYQRQRVRKWETDIRVQIMNIDNLNRKTIDEVDSVIAILAPLIAPLKIERVYSNGNLLVSRDVDVIPSTQSEPRALKGLTKMNPETMYSWSICQAHVYDRYHSDGLTLMHEFEHALGLDHPTKVYSCALTIGWGATGQLFKPEEWHAYKEKNYRLTELEKTVIRMLYSPAIKSGLNKEIFLMKMGMK